MADDRLPAIVVLTGAGISRESGLATFRDPDGIWATTGIEDVATPHAFRRHPDRVHAFYNARRAQLRNPAIGPNAAHHALAELERRWRGEMLLVTQNVDDLHDRAGSRNLVHMHGELMKASCLCCAARTPWIDDLSRQTACPACHAVGWMRPAVVWFGEAPLEMDRIQSALETCRLFIAIGTSSHIYPAAGFVAEVAGLARTVELNLEPTGATRLFDEAHHGPATQIVPSFVQHLLRAHGG